MIEQIIWETKNDDNLLTADAAIRFLNSEFQPECADKVWFDGYFDWKIGKLNPAGNGYLTSGIAEGQTIATVSLSRKRILFNGKEYIGAEFGDAYCSNRFFNNLSVYVPKELVEGYSSRNHYLNKSIFGRVAYETTQRALDNGVTILYGTPNQNAFPSWVKRLGHFHFQDHNIVSCSRPTFRYIIARFRILKPLRYFLKYLELFILATLQFFYKVRSGSNHVTKKEIPTEDEINQLWEITKPGSGFALVRDFLYWKHRYINHPLAKYIFFTVRSDNKVCGIIPVCIQKVAQDTYVCYLLEWMIAPGFYFDQILAEIIFQLKGEPISYFVTYCNPGAEDGLAFKRNFFKSGSKVNITFYNNSLINAESLHNIPFQFFMGSTDAV